MMANRTLTSDWIRQSPTWIAVAFAPFAILTTAGIGFFWFNKDVRRLDGQRARDDNSNMSLDYPVILKKSEEGYAVGCPALPGCWSQGATEEEALQNIRIAIREYLEVLQEKLKGEDVRSVTVSV